ncbi:hypothetical protein GQ607_002579 [Colletotrichum asianum]|uniref:Uncharacterized protein n=1 Tax=Colletotrichum asianum TaxID=702518 RepID=A0A8H3ZRW5_9PEZI|nr:hypothetical protein GQ607_002579 [Colletotrichum asianum]
MDCSGAGRREALRRRRIWPAGELEAERRTDTLTLPTYLVFSAAERECCVVSARGLLLPTTPFIATLESKLSGLEFREFLFWVFFF